MAATSQSYIEKGLQFIEHGKYLEAIETFSTAIQVDDQEAELYYYKAVALGKLARFPEAVEQLDNAISHGAKYLTTCNYIKGCAYLKEHHYEQAFSHFEEAKKHFNVENPERFVTLEDICEKLAIAIEKKNEEEEEKRMERLLNAQLYRLVKERNFMHQNELLHDFLERCLVPQSKSFITIHEEFISSIQAIKNDKFNPINLKYIHHINDIEELAEFFISVYKIIHSIHLNTYEISTLTTKFKKLFKHRDPFTQIAKRDMILNPLTTIPQSMYIYLNIFNFLLPHIFSTTQKLITQLSNPDNSTSNSGHFWQRTRFTNMITNKASYNNPSPTRVSPSSNDISGSYNNTNMVNNSICNSSSNPSEDINNIIAKLKYFSNYFVEMHIKFQKQKSQNVQHAVSEICKALPTFCEPCLGLRELNETSISHLIPNENKLKSTINQRHNIVIEYNQIHFTCLTSSNKNLKVVSPTSYGTQMIVHGLHNAISDVSLPPTTIVKVERGKDCNIFEASKMLVGIDFLYVLEKKPHWITLVDIDSFSSMIILSILTNPQDGKPDNFIVEVESDLVSLSTDDLKRSGSGNGTGAQSLESDLLHDIHHMIDHFYIDKKNADAADFVLTNDSHDQQQLRIKKLKIVGVHNDFAFGDPISQVITPQSNDNERDCNNNNNNNNVHPSEVVNVRNVLYFFPQMDEEVGTNFRNQLLNKCTELILIDFLHYLYMKNSGYEKLLATELLTQNDCEGCFQGDVGLDLPLKLPKNLISSLFESLHQIQAYLLDHPTATHRDLLSHFQPKVAEFYKQIQQSVMNDKKDQDLHTNINDNHINNNSNINNIHNVNNANHANSRNSENHRHHHHHHHHQSSTVKGEILMMLKKNPCEANQKIVTILECLDEVYHKGGAFPKSYQKEDLTPMQNYRKRRNLFNYSSEKLAKFVAKPLRDSKVSESAYELMKMINFEPSSHLYHNPTIVPKRIIDRICESELLMGVFRKLGPYSDRLLLRGSMIDPDTLIEYLEKCSLLSQLSLVSCSQICFYTIERILRSHKSLTISLDLFPLFHYPLLNSPSKLTSGNHDDNHPQNNNNDNKIIHIDDGGGGGTGGGTDGGSDVYHKFNQRILFQLYENVSLLSLINQMILNKRLILYIGVDRLEICCNFAQYHSKVLYYILIIIMKDPFSYSTQRIIDLFDLLIDNAGADVDFHHEDLRNYQALHIFCKYFPHRSLMIDHDHDDELLDNSFLYNEQEKLWCFTMLQYFVVTRKANIHGIDESGHTPLKKAQIQKNLYLISLLSPYLNNKKT